MHMMRGREGEQERKGEGVREKDEIDREQESEGSYPGEAKQERLKEIESNRVVGEKAKAKEESREVGGS